MDIKINISTKVKKQNSRTSSKVSLPPTHKTVFQKHNISNWKDFHDKSTKTTTINSESSSSTLEQLLTDLHLKLPYRVLIFLSRLLHVDAIAFDLLAEFTNGDRFHLELLVKFVATSLLGSDLTFKFVTPGWAQLLFVVNDFAFTINL